MFLERNLWLVDRIIIIELNDEQNCKTDIKEYKRIIKKKRKKFKRGRKKKDLEKMSTRKRR